MSEPLTEAAGSLPSGGIRAMDAAAGPPVDPARLESARSDSWLDGESAETGERVRWVPLVQRGPGHPNEAVGLSRSGAWVVGDLPGTGEDTPRVHTRPRALWLLPLLEWSYDEAAARFRDGVTRAGLDEELALAFPWRQVLDVAIECKRGWWLEHALAWLPHLGPTPDDLAVLSDVVRDKRYGQRLRQAAWRLLPADERRRHAKRAT